MGLDEPTGTGTSRRRSCRRKSLRRALLLLAVLLTGIGLVALPGSPLSAPWADPLPAEAPNSTDQPEASSDRNPKASEGPVTPPTGRTLLEFDIDGVPTGTVTRRTFREHFGPVNASRSSSFANLEVVMEHGHRILRSHNPAFVGGGANLQVSLPEGVDEAVLSYRVRFSDDFDFNKGGKLPGLAGAAPGFDLSDASGGNRPQGDDAFSARGMWFSNEAYRRYRPGEAVQYLYYPEMREFFGERLEYGVAYARGQWVEVTSHVVLNDPGERNGSISIFWDGKKTARADDLVLRTSEELDINLIAFATFRGGDDDTWYSNDDGWIDLDEVRVTVPSPSD